MRIAFYKTQKGDFWGNAITHYTGFFNWIGCGFKQQPSYSHVEIGFESCDIREYVNEECGLVSDQLRDKFVGCKVGECLWFSSASRNADGTHGTRWIEQDILLKHPERWDIFELIPLRSSYDMIDACEGNIGMKYDWFGICGFATLLGQLNSKKRWYCSEVCQFVLTGKWIKRVSPIALYWLFKNRLRKVS